MGGPPFSRKERGEKDGGTLLLVVSPRWKLMLDCQPIGSQMFNNWVAQRSYLTLLLNPP
jgi:hypothetical protein